jgi:hypothetical protein
MRLYQLPIPILDNQGVAYSPATREAFLAAVLRECGGYTLSGETWHGAWRDPSSGIVYTDRVLLLQFAMDKPVKVNRIVHDFRRLFPDQLCAMVADLGVVTFHNLKQEERA